MRTSCHLASTLRRSTLYTHVSPLHCANDGMSQALHALHSHPQGLLRLSQSMTSNTAQ